ncbi:MAG: hypothetical protein Q8L59_09975 [Phenylobacterium sp.]|uniref:hypothetical protein n=1 Tax=Phenylobacterium sp. TaxID=1871053 RepID=UPI002732F7EC|nr:hypothetical protein [Phenylobacterium sp.]MDP1642498.1 hypothetical protein [Phenylobacterium sp.]MDP3117842.1 hypothetical protein [Phenylobacterium sp.]MDP3382515.1 hypothetical protein [Phenylobacterium sp.]
MKRLDLDDLPPRVAQLLTGLAEGEELILVQGGAVAARLHGGAAPEPAAEDEPEPYNNQRAAEIFEQFRSAIEDEF